MPKLSKGQKKKAQKRRQQERTNLLEEARTKASSDPAYNELNGGDAFKNATREVTKDMSLTEQIQFEITKHKDHIKSNQENLVKVQMGLGWLGLMPEGNRDELKEQCEARSDEISSKIKHGELMVKLFETWILLQPPQQVRSIVEDRVNIIKQVIKDLKANLQDWEDSMRRCVELGLYSEGEYEDLMRNLMKDINRFAGPFGM